MQLTSQFVIGALALASIATVNASPYPAAGKLRRIAPTQGEVIPYPTQAVSSLVARQQNKYDHLDSQSAASSQGSNIIYGNSPQVDNSNNAKQGATKGNTQQQPNTSNSNKTKQTGNGGDADSGINFLDLLSRDSSESTDDSSAAYGKHTASGSSIKYNAATSNSHSASVKDNAVTGNNHSASVKDNAATGNSHSASVKDNTAGNKHKSSLSQATKSRPNNAASDSNNAAFASNNHKSSLTTSTTTTPDDGAYFSTYDPKSPQVSKHNKRQVPSLSTVTGTEDSIVKTIPAVPGVPGVPAIP